MMMQIVILIVSFLGMEMVAWGTHKYIMHGPLWFFHQDHHTPSHAGFFEKNDFFFLLFALPGIILIYFGWKAGWENLMLWSGFGITLYGLAYFLVHDIFIHQRFRLFRKTDNIYFKAIRRAHKMHHKHLTKADGECFGMLWVPFKYLKQRA